MRTSTAGARRRKIASSPGIPTLPPLVPRAEGERQPTRLFLHAGAYWPMCSLRSAMPKRPTWRVAQFDILRLRLIKIAAG